ncbi:hypothetical protein G9P44_003461 [Scheffersomyces stipitis]|nr:hypothetical protein G9P44_003461 [Scheffersomyces stipitis]
MSSTPSSEFETLLPKPINKTPINPNNLTNLEEAVNNAYEAIVDDDDDYENSTNEDIVWLREQRTHNKTLHWFKRPSVMMISLIPFIFAFGNSSAESTRQVITLKLCCNYLSNGSGSCNPAEAQILMSNLQLGYSISSGIISLIASGKMGPYSDRYGRKLFIVLILFCLVLGRSSRFLIMYNFDSLKFALMILTEITANICGGILTLVTLANCYISDVVEPHQRIYSLGISVASMMVGLSVGPIVGNFILSFTTNVSQNIIDINTSISREEFNPLKFELVIFISGLLFAVFVLPESRSERARRKSRSMSQSSLVLLETEQPQSKWSSFASGANFMKPLRLFLLPSDVVNRGNPQRQKRDRFAVLVMVIVDCIMSSLAISLGELYILYGIYSFGWNQRDIGHLLAITCSSRAFVLLILSPIINHRILQKFFGFRVLKKQLDMIDYSMASLGLFVDAILLMSLHLMRTTPTFFLIMACNSLGSLISPTLNSAIVKFYPESKIGELFGAIALLKNIFTLLGPVLFISIYKYTLSTWNRPDVVFTLAGAILAVCFISFYIVKRVINLDADSESDFLSRSNSVVSFSDQLRRSSSSSKLNYTTTITEESAAPKTTLPPKPYTELHRKSSFVHKERNLIS